MRDLLYQSCRLCARKASVAWCICSSRFPTHWHITPRSRAIVSFHLRQRRFGLGQPEGHIHGAVEVDGGGQSSAGLLTTAGLVVQPAQPVVAVGLRAGACPVPRPGPGPAGSGLRPARHRGGQRGQGRRQAGAARAPRPRGLSAAGPGRAPGERAARPLRRVPPDDRSR